MTSGPPLQPARDAYRDVAEHCAHVNLKKAARAATRLYDEALRPVGLTITQFSLLVAVELAGPVPITVLAEELALDRTTLTRNLQPLERRGVLEVGRSDTDRRTRLVGITEAGAHLLAQAEPRWRAAQERVLDAFGAAAGRRDFERFLESTRLVVSLAP